MHQAPVLLVVHILLTVAWLGVDVGVFTSSFVMRRPNMTTETRLTVRSIMRNLDLAPRLSLILMIPVAVGLSHQTGWGLQDTPEWVIWVVFGAGIVWAGASVAAFRATGPTGRAPSWAARFAMADGLLRGVASAFFLVTGIWSLVGDGPWHVDWLAWKASLFGSIIAFGLWIRVAARRYHPALAELLEEGETPERLARLNRDIRGVYPPVLLIWSLLVVMIVLAVARP
jgi:hypothetical protein